MIQKQYASSRKFGFTMVEILIASGIFSIFCVGLFSFYRMGSGMFLKGSWKLRKQKECERFLSRLKERIEQTSSAVFIDPSNDPSAQIVENKAKFVTLDSGSAIGTGTAGLEPAGLTRLMLFSVCKPDLSRLPGQGSSKGLRLFHGLALVQSSNTLAGAKKLYTLCMGTTTSNTNTAINGVDFFNSTTDFKPAIPAGGDFSASPSDYSLGGDPSFTKLTDVSFIEIDWGLAALEGVATEATKVIGLKVGMQNPKYPETKVQQRMQAKLDFTIPMDAFAVGDI